MKAKSKYRPRNQILSSLKPADLRAILTCMELVEIDAREPLYESNAPIEYAYFPEDGVMSIVIPMEDGPSVEAATVGYEGMVGLPLILGAEATPTMALCQVPGKVWSISAKDLAKHIEQNKDLSLALRRYAQTVFDLLAQSTACNRLHSIDERCARRLLLTMDRMSTDTFQLTQEFLAMMLGVYRPGVSLAAKRLQEANLITYKHGKVTILDREGLEEVSCSCYRIIREAYEKLVYS